MDTKKIIDRIKALRNESDMDRLLRVVAADVMAVMAYFWVGLPWSAVLWVLAFVAAFTAAIGFCPLYRTFGISTYRPGQEMCKYLMGVLILAVAVIPSIGGIISAEVTSERFMGDFVRVDYRFQQVASAARVNDAAGLSAGLPLWQEEFGRFSDRYKNYRPFVVKYDFRLDNDLDEIAALSANSQVDPKVRRISVSTLNGQLEHVGKIWNSIRDRNRMPIYDMAVIGMKQISGQLLVAAQTMDAPTILRLYPWFDLKLREMEANSDSDDGTIRLLRLSLENLLNSARLGEAGKLPGLGDELAVRLEVF